MQFVETHEGVAVRACDCEGGRLSTHPYIPLYVDDYDAATAHLTPAEDGVYMRLMRLCWRTPGCSLPLDPIHLATQIRAPVEIVRAMLAEFFVLRRARYVSPALERWLARLATPDRRDRRGVSAELRAFILERDGYTCSYCGEQDAPLHVDHVIPVCRGGSDAFENLVCACARCNLSKGAKLLSEWRPA